MDDYLFLLSFATISRESNNNIVLKNLVRNPFVFPSFLYHDLQLKQQQQRPGEQDWVLQERKGKERRP